MSGLLLVADDLTGALDSAASFCGRLGPIPVWLGMPQGSMPVHAGVDLATRDADAAFALQAMTGAAAQLARADIAFKKIDSLLRGHWPAELAAVLRHTPFPTCVFAPAFPGQGRTMRHGRLQVRQADGSTTTLPIDPVASMRALGLQVQHAGSDMLEAGHGPGPAGARVVVADAEDDDDLRAVVRWGRCLGHPVLWCGAAGLARALAEVETPRVATLRWPLLAVVGSAHPVSQQQVAHVVAHNPAHRVVARAESAQTAAALADTVARLGSALLTFDFPPGTAAPDASAAIARKLQALLPLLARPQTLLVAGGDTLRNVCRALGATHLEVDAELTPGIPRSRLRSGLWDGIEVISKSGAFGGPALLDEILAKVA